MAAKKKTKKGKKSYLFIILTLIAGGIFLPTSLLLMVGLLPSLVVGFVDRTSKKSKAVTVGAMNLAGCSPFLLELWADGNNFEKSFSIISDPTAIIVMYSAAGVGYLINWAMGGIVSSVVYQRGVARKKAIEKRQEELIKRWGKEVTGQVPLDEEGFPIPQTEDKIVPGL